MTEEGKLGTCWEQVVISRYSGSQWLRYSRLYQSVISWVFQLRVGFSAFSVLWDTERAKREINEAREIRTPNLLIWSQMHRRCAIAP